MYKYIKNGVRMLKYIIILIIALTTVVYASRFGNLLLSGNSISATDTNGDVELLPSGTGSVKLDNSSTVGYLWTATDTLGRGSWQAAPAGGANTALSNLTSPTAINQDLLPDTPISKSVGTQASPFSASSISTMNVASLRIKSSVTSSSIRTYIDTNQNTPSGTFSNTAMRIATAGAEPLSIFSVNSGSSTQSRPLNFETGNNTSTGNSGNILVQTGSSTNANSGDISLIVGTAGGTRGSIQFKDGSEGAAGECWVSKDTSGGGNWDTCPGGGGGAFQLNVTTQTTAYTALSTDDYIGVSGGTFTVTLPAAAGAADKVYIIKKTDSSLSNIITIDPNGAELIGGVSTKTLNTQNESYKIVSDGTGWVILNHETATPLTSDGVITIQATITNPTKPATTRDVVYWKREGQYLWARYDYDHNAVGTAGNGDYLISIPQSANLAIDTTFITLNTAAGIEVQTTTIGEFSGNCGGTYDFNAGHAIPYSATQFRITGRLAGSVSPFGINTCHLGFATVTFGGWIKVPISGWDE